MINYISNLDYVRDIDEIRVGFHGTTFQRLLRRRALRSIDV